MPEGLEPARRQATVMDLLGMTAGLCYPGDDPAGRAAAALYTDGNPRAVYSGPCSVKQRAARLF